MMYTANRITSAIPYVRHFSPATGVRDPYLYHTPYLILLRIIITYLGTFLIIYLKVKYPGSEAIR